MRQLVLFILAFTLHLSAANNQVENGLLAYGNETYDSLQVNGSAKLNGTIVTQLLQVNGSLVASNAKIGELHVNGQAALDKCTVSKKSMVSGTLSASFTTFDQELTLASDNSAFETCTLSSIRVMKSKDNISQTVLLGGSTKVTGLITFESGNGQVVAGPDCQITQASVVGGKLQKSSS